MKLSRWGGGGGGGGGVTWGQVMWDKLGTQYFQKKGYLTMPFMQVFCLAPTV